MSVHPNWAGIKSGNRTRQQSVAKLLADAKRLAGDKAVESARKLDYTSSREWSSLAVEIDGLLRDSVELVARG